MEFASSKLRDRVKPTLATAAEGIQAGMNARMKVAMKGGPAMKAELGAIRLIISAMTTKMKEDGVDSLSDDVALSVLTKLAKMRKESIAMYVARTQPRTDASLAKAVRTCAHMHYHLATPALVPTPSKVPKCWCRRSGKE